MKHRITPFLAFVLLIATATAQGEWKWAHYWTGGDGSYNDYYNYITNTAFDDEGKNIELYDLQGRKLGNLVGMAHKCRYWICRPIPPAPTS